MQTASDVIVIGGGPAGMMAAGQAAAAGARTILFEKMALPGRKLRLTGKGRCNITTTAGMDAFIEAVHPDGRFLRPALTGFFNTELVSFMSEIGVSTVEERGGRVFPRSGRAQDVVDALAQWMLSRGVTVRTGSRVSELIFDDGRLAGVGLDGGTGGSYLAPAVIVATGGKSYPATGSTGDGYDLARAGGHSIVPVLPALVPLEIDRSLLEPLVGLELRNIRLKIIIGSRKRTEHFGEMEFITNGISGPVVLTASRPVVRALEQGREVIASLDLKPALDREKLVKRLEREIDRRGAEPAVSLLRSLLPATLAPVGLEMCGISSGTRGNELSTAERNRFLDWLKDFRFPITGYRSYEEAIVTSGGVSTRELNPASMESKLVKGVFFAGEVVDLDGDTGGYNLQIAFSTGWLAGRSAAVLT